MCLPHRAISVILGSLSLSSLAPAAVAAPTSTCISAVDAVGKIESAVNPFIALVHGGSSYSDPAVASAGDVAIHTISAQSGVLARSGKTAGVEELVAETNAHLGASKLQVAIHSKNGAEALDLAQKRFAEGAAEVRDVCGKQ